MWEKIALTTLTILLKMVAILRFRVLYIFSDMVYPLIYYVVGYRRKVVRTNLTKSFPELDLKEIVKIEKKFYRHFCDYVFETIKLLHISDKQMQSRLRFTNIEEIEKRRGDGRPFFIYLAHQGNWDYGANRACRGARFTTRSRTKQWINFSYVCVHVSTLSASHRNKRCA